MSKFKNFRNGLFRLWLVITIPWCAWFSWQTYDSYSDKIAYQNLVSKTSKMIIESSKDISDGKEYQQEMYRWANKRLPEYIYARDKASERLDLNVKLLPIPFALLLFYPLTIWIMRGFREV